MILLASAMRLAWLLEQPGSSQMEWHPRFRYMIRALPHVSSLNGKLLNSLCSSGLLYVYKNIDSRQPSHLLLVSCPVLPYVLMYVTFEVPPGLLEKMEVP